MMNNQNDTSGERGGGSLERVVSRSAFESWITAPPIERNIERWPDDERKTAWPGQYCDYATQLAWEAWQAAANAEASQSADGEMK